jgi:hypothetical protein
MTKKGQTFERSGFDEQSRALPFVQSLLHGSRPVLKIVFLKDTHLFFIFGTPESSVIRRRQLSSREEILSFPRL